MSRLFQVRPRHPCLEEEPRLHTLCCLGPRCCPSEGPVSLLILFSILGKTAPFSRFYVTHLEPSFSLRHLHLLLVSDMQLPRWEAQLHSPTFSRLLPTSQKRSYLFPNFSVLLNRKVWSGQGRGASICAHLFGGKLDQKYRN